MSVLDALQAVLDSSVVRTDADVVWAYARDQAAVVPAGEPLVLVRARSVDDVVATFDADLNDAVDRVGVRHDLRSGWLNDAAAAFWPA